MKKYRTVIVPEGFGWTAALLAAAEQFVRQGGGLLTEGALPDGAGNAASPKKLIGIAENSVRSEELQAAYIRFEPEGKDHPLHAGLQSTELLPLRGRVSYCETDQQDSSVTVLATLVPPFSPPEAVGAPPERASLPVPQTDLPLIVARQSGQGRTLYLPFSLSRLIADYKLADHYRLAANAVRWLLGKAPSIETNEVPGLQLTVFRKNEERLVHLVNGAGRRPLTAILPLHDVELSLTTENDPGSYTAECLISGERPETSVRGGKLIVKITKLSSWECVHVYQSVFDSQ